MSKKKQKKLIGVGHQDVLVVAYDINRHLDAAFPPEKFFGHEEALLMAAISRVGVANVKALLGAAG